MDIETTAIPDVKIFTPRRFEDARGYFMETFSTRKFDPHAPGLSFVQDNESFSRDVHTVRGLHYQKPPFAQDKLVRVVSGAVFDVVVDVRRGSPTYGKWIGAELTAKQPQAAPCAEGFPARLHDARARHARRLQGHEFL